MIHKVACGKGLWSGGSVKIRSLLEFDRDFERELPLVTAGGTETGLRNLWAQIRWL